MRNLPRRLVIKILHIDIETSPNLAHVWGIWQQNVGINQLMDVTEVLCFAAKWDGAKRIHFYSKHVHGKEGMISAAHALLDESDAVVHYNGMSFDIPHLNREFLELEMAPPSSFKQIDLLQTARKQFNFPSNKLDYVTRALGIGEKVKHVGHELWIRCMNDEPEAWQEMAKYNIQDVKLTEQLYHRLLPWIKGHPNVALYGETNDTDDDSPICPRCGNTEITRQGYAYTGVSKFQQYQCKSCGAWFRGRQNLADRTRLASNIA